ncbi:riboflavin biosynthesis protein RibF [Parabacteroides sp. OttesenSCG-928-N08]|nr:riboflavin biosynthesis protein RibF [Parabacteroides sp. OttesenSCG-928-N08]
MMIITDSHSLHEERLVATIGFFDGVHLGHRHLIDEMRELARRKGLPAAVITFPVHPRVVLQSHYQPKLLNSYQEKLEHLASTGIDYCIVMDFTSALAQLSAEQFIREVLKQHYHVETLLVGYDHRFGRDRSDGFEQYVEYGAACGMQVVKAGSLVKEQTTVSSSEIRRQLLQGKVEKAAAMLSYPYQIKGSIVDGYKVGRKLGFPTANIRLDEPFKVIPAFGVYAVKVAFDNRHYKGMLYVGNRPTFHDNDERVLEVNILDFNEDIYNKEITVSFLHYVREDITFDSPEALATQLIKDRATVNELLQYA